NPATQSKCMRNRNALVLFAVQDEDWATHLRDVKERGAVAVQVGLFPRLTAQVVGQVAGAVRGAGQAYQVADARSYGGGSEPIRLGNGPGAQVAAVTPAQNSQAFRVRNTEGDHEVDAGHKVSEVTAAPVTVVGVAELLAVTAAPTDVAPKDRIPPGRERRHRVELRGAPEVLDEYAFRPAV